jgi:hypothetical protein
MTETDYARALIELDRLLNDPDVPLQPGLIWQMLDKVLDLNSPGGATLSPSMAIADQKDNQPRAPAGA